jgi:hypothetical protein
MERLTASSAAAIPALGIVIAAVAGIYSNPYFREIGASKPSAVIQGISAVAGDPCERSVVIRAQVPSGDVIALGSRQQGTREEDFQSSLTRQSDQQWLFTIEIGDHTEAGHTFILTPIILPSVQEGDLLDAIRTSTNQDATTTYWPSTGPPSSTIYVGEPRTVVRTSKTTGCPQ